MFTCNTDGLLFVLVTLLTISLITFVVFAYHNCSTRTATSLTLTYVSSLCRKFSVIIETNLASKMSIAFVRGESNTFKCARRTGHAFATRLMADELSVVSTTFVASLTDVLLHHAYRQVCDHVIVPIDIIVKYVMSLRGFDMTYKQCIITT